MESPFEKEIITKDPDAILNYSLDWSAWLNGETINTSNWVVPPGITLVSSSNNDTTVVFRLSGGSAGNDYELVNTITTSPSAQSTPRAVIIHVVNVERLASVLNATPGGATSNSYITLADAKTYFNWRLYTDAWDEANDQARETALLVACQRLEQEDYVGVVVDDVQALKWPRQLNANGDLIRTYPVNTIPKPMKDAQCEVALWYLQNDISSAAAAGAVSELQIGKSVKATFASGSTAVETATDFNGLPIQAAHFLKGLRLHSVLA